jgi:hypothetical protein
MKKERFQFIFLIGLLFFIIGILYKNDGNIFPQKYQYETIDMGGGEYIRFVYIGSSGCYFSNNDEMHEMIVSLKKETKFFAKKCQRILYPLV